MRIILLSLLFLACSAPLFAQEINPSVSVSMELLSPEQRIDIQSLENDLKNYLSGQRYLTTEWQGEKIPVDINIYITGKSSSYYTAKLYFSSKRKIGFKGDEYSVMTRFLYDNWSFPYSNGGATFSFQSTRFNSFSSIIDFYALLAIGYDMDSYAELDGARAFSLAQDVAMTASSNDAPGFKRFIQPGDLSNLGLINDILDLRMEDFRRAIFSYCADGLDSLTINKEIGEKNLTDALGDMYYFKKQKITSPSLSMQSFFDSKYTEFCNIFRGKKGSQAFQYLKYLDPAHSTLYNESEAGK